jgi:hypothetical protein
MKNKNTVIGDFHATAVNVLNNHKDLIGNDDEIGNAMFAAGIPFSQIKKLVQEVGVELGLIVDTREIKANILSHLEGSEDMVFAKHSQFEALVQELVEEVKGSDEKIATSVLKAYCKKNEIAIPAAPKAGDKKSGRLGKLNQIYIETFKANPNATREDLFRALLPATKTKKNAFDYASTMHVMLWAIANGKTVEEAMSEVGGQTINMREDDNIKAE